MADYSWLVVMYRYRWYGVECFLSVRRLPFVLTLLRSPFTLVNFVVRGLRLLGNFRKRHIEYTYVPVFWSAGFKYLPAKCKTIATAEDVPGKEFEHVRMPLLNSFVEFVLPVI